MKRLIIGIAAASSIFSICILASFNIGYNVGYEKGHNKASKDIRLLYDLDKIDNEQFLEMLEPDY